LTGYGSEGDRQKALEAGFNVHLTKPANTGELIRAIEICLPGEMHREARA
jgi:CheY-like chemotaxis protein